jgi:O-antigen/teichoic acid export membrane protein
MKDLKQKAIRGGFAKVCAQAANFILRLASVMILARLLTPRDFGLVGMVTALTGVLGLFRDFGLSSAAIQRANVTEEQTSTLFWINMLVGAILAVLSFLMAPAISAFYHEPRLLGVTVALGAGFLLNAAGVQHGALLQREMRFTTVAMLDILALVLSIMVGIGMALSGYGYWALVGMTLTAPLVSTVGAWVATRWIPGFTRNWDGIRSMMRFGGTITLNSLVVYVGYNLEKVLLGRYWGADVVGIYGRAYQLTNIPTDNLNSSIGGVAFSALSRVQDDPQRLKSYFLKGYSLVLALTLPITLVCTLFANDAILVLLGQKWQEAIPIFRLLAPTILIFAMINPFSWLLFSIGLVGRSLKIALVIAPLVITATVIGLPYGPRGVAFAYSTAMTLWVVPHIAWCVHGTMVSVRDVLQALSRPMLSGIVAGVLTFALQFFYGPMLSPLPRLLVGVAFFASAYLGMLMYVMGQKRFYLDLIRGLRRRPSVEESAMASV